MDESNRDTTDITVLINFLKSRESYPHEPDSVQHVQTHISNVFIASPYVYKTKKRVDFGFLDYSTLEKRKYFCEQEVELNRRLCSEIYLDVVCIVKRDDNLLLIPSGDQAGNDLTIDYAVKMKMLDETWFLHTFIGHEELTHEHLDRVANKLTDFYSDQGPDESVLQYGEVEKIRFNTDENFKQTEEFIDDTIQPEAFSAIRYFTNSYLDRKIDLFQRRISENRIVDGHGDLHLEHIHVSPGGVCIYDCIEFNERLRCGDQAADLAFLAMDLDFNDCWSDSRYFVDQMAQKLNDPDLTKIIDFYKCYRAYVKGKVKSMKSAEEEVDEADREEAEQKAKVYFDLSLRYALIGSRPVILICMGRIGTGKSTIASSLGSAFGVDVYSSDKIRKEMAGVPLNERPTSEKREELYSPEMSQKTYHSIKEQAIACFKEGKSAILDATFSQASGRCELIEKLESLGADYLFIEAQASDEIVKSRLKDRANGDDVVSDARLEDFEMLTERYEAPSEINAAKKIEVDTGSELKNTLERLYRKMIDRQFG